MLSLSRFRARWAFFTSLAASFSSLGAILVGCVSSPGSGGDEAVGAGDGDGDGDGFSGDGDSSDGDPIYLDDPDAAGGAGGAPSSACLDLMSWGAVAQMGAVPGADGMDAIVNWLNLESSASAVHVSEKPEVTASFLAGVDVILLQDMSGWEFDEEELHVFEEWVQGGGSVMALSGYGTDGEQVEVTNRLLSFTGMNYYGSSENGQTSTNLSECAYCLGTTHKQIGWNDKHPIGEGIDAVGAYSGRAIHGEGDIVAQEEGQVLALAKEVGEGRAFLFHDDWVSYSAMWQQDAPLECEENEACEEVSPTTTYQVARFWFNAIRWLVPEASCFSIDDELVAK